MLASFHRDHGRQFHLRAKWRVVSVLVLSLLGVHGASAQKITVEFDQAADFSKYKTFAIREGELNSKNPALNSELVKKRIDLDIERALTAKGLTKVSGPSDLNVAYRFGSARRVETERNCPPPRRAG